MKNKNLKIAVLTLVVIGGGIWGAHKYALHRLEKAFLDYVETEKDDGTMLSYDGYSTRMGFFDLILTIQNPSMQADESWIEKANLEGMLIITISLFSPRQIVFSSQGKSHIYWKSPHPSEPPFITTDGFEGVTSLNEYGRLAKTEIRFTQGQLILPSFKAPYLFTEGGIIKFKKNHQKKQFKLDLSSQSIHLNKEIVTPFGDTIENLDFKASISDVESHKTFSSFLQNWFDASGTLEVEKLQFKWGALDLDSQGTVALDESLQPLIALTAEVKNLNITLQALVEQKLISQKTIPLIQLLLGGIGQREENDSKYKISLTLQDGELSLGSIPLARGLKIQWG